MRRFIDQRRAINRNQPANDTTISARQAVQTEIEKAEKAIERQERLKINLGPSPVIDREIDRLKTFIALERRRIQQGVFDRPQDDDDNDDIPNGDASDGEQPDLPPNNLPQFAVLPERKRLTVSAYLMTFQTNKKYVANDPFIVSLMNMNVKQKIKQTMETHCKREFAKWKTNTPNADRGMMSYANIVAAGGSSQSLDGFFDKCFMFVGEWEGGEGDNVGRKRYHIHGVLTVYHKQYYQLELDNIRAHFRGPEYQILGRGIFTYVNAKLLANDFAALQYTLKAGQILLPHWNMATNEVVPHILLKERAEEPAATTKPTTKQVLIDIWETPAAGITPPHALFSPQFESQRDSVRVAEGGAPGVALSTLPRGTNPAFGAPVPVRFGPRDNNNNNNNIDAANANGNVNNYGADGVQYRGR